MIMALQMLVQVFLFFVCSFIPESECKGIGTVSTPPPSTRPYPGCGVKLDFEITGHVWNGMEVGENAYPWMAFLYNFDRDSFGLDIMDLDLPAACKPKTTTTTSKTTTASSNTSNTHSTHS